MQHVVKDTVEFRHSEMPKIYWQKHKKPSIDLMSDNPFTIDRQLEDQRYLQELNRNPRAGLATKIEKTRSEKIIAKIGASSVLATKAKVLNKFVRDASGVNAYAMVPPPRQKDTSYVKEDFDPETHPLVKPYRMESQRKPVMCSFGHRPKSASRTFYPATLKDHLGHGEVAPVQAAGKTGVGLSVATLAKLIHAPRLLYPNQMASEVEAEEKRQREAMGYDLDDDNTSSLNDDLFGGFVDGTGTLGSTSQGQRRTAKSNAGKMTTEGKRKKPPMTKESSNVSIFDDDSVYSTLPENANKARPDWNDGFQNIPPNPAAVYALKSSGGMNDVNLPLHARLHRFSSLTVSERAINPFCAEKQMNDWEERRTGQPIKVKKASPVKGTHAYFDPLTDQFNRVKAQNKRDTEQLEEHRRKLDYITAVKLIPEVPYFPGDVAETLRNYTASSDMDISESQGLGAIGEAAFNSTGNVSVRGTGNSTSNGRVRARDITAMALDGLYTSNFAAPKHIDTCLNTSMDNFEQDTLRKDERNKKLFSYEATDDVPGSHSNVASRRGTAKKISTASPTAAGRKNLSRRSSNSRRGTSEKILYSFEHTGSGSGHPSPVNVPHSLDHGGVGSYSQTNLTKLKPLQSHMAKSAPQLVKNTCVGAELSTMSAIPAGSHGSTVTFEDSVDVSFGNEKERSLMSGSQSSFARRRLGAGSAGSGSGIGGGGGGGSRLSGTSSHNISRVKSDAQMLDRTLREAKKGNLDVLYRHYMTTDEDDSYNENEHTVGEGVDFGRTM